MRRMNAFNRRICACELYVVGSGPAGACLAARTPPAAFSEGVQTSCEQFSTPTVRLVVIKDRANAQAVQQERIVGPPSVDQAGLLAFLFLVPRDEDRDGLGRFAGGKDQSPRGSLVILSCLGGAVGGVVVDADGQAGCPRKRHGERQDANAAVALGDAGINNRDY